MNRSLIVCLAMLASAGTVAWAGSTASKTAPSAVSPAKELSLIGRIQSIDAKTNTLTLEHGKTTKVITIDKQCRYEGFEPKVTSLTGLKAGESLRVAYAEKNGKMVADKVERIVMHVTAPAPIKN